MTEDGGKVLQDLVEPVPLPGLACPGPELHKVRLFSSPSLLGASLLLSQGFQARLSLVETGQLRFLHIENCTCYHLSEGELYGVVLNYFQFL